VLECLKEYAKLRVCAQYTKYQRQKTATAVKFNELKLLYALQINLSTINCTFPDIGYFYFYILLVY
jgi:hypothetical protein